MRAQQVRCTIVHVLVLERPFCSAFSHGEQKPASNTSSLHIVRQICSRDSTTIVATTLLGPVLTTFLRPTKMQDSSFGVTLEGDVHLFEKFSSCFRNEIPLFVHARMKQCTRSEIPVLCQVSIPLVRLITHEWGPVKPHD